MSEHKPPALVSRRQFLRGTLIGAGVVTVTACGGTAGTPSAPPAAENVTTGPTPEAAVTAATGAGGGDAAEATPAPAEPTKPAAASNANVVLKTASWPFTPLPSAEDQAASPNTKAYADALQGWFDQNPGVAIETVEVNIWGQQELVTAVSGGTAPTYFMGNVLGGWNDIATRSAFLQGLAADVTDLVQRYGITGKIVEQAKPLWDKWQVNGRYYSSVDSFGVGNGIYYRKDLVRERGLKEPKQGWTWEDFREVAKGLTKDKMKGAAMQQWGLGWNLGAEGFDLLTQLPTPETSWNWTRDLSDPRWVPIVERYRQMIYEDKSILTDVSYTDGEVAQAFVRGDAGMMPNNSGWYTRNPDDPGGMFGLEKAVGKPIQEVVGWAHHPVGENGHFGNTYHFIALMTFDPNLDAETLDKAFNLYDYMYFGAAYDQQKVAIYEATKDLRKVYSDAAPISGKTQIEGVPGNIDDAWGKEYMDTIRAAMDLPQPPNQAWYIPPNEEAGPGAEAMGDATSRFTYEAGTVDIAGDFQKAADTLNQQYEGFTSTVPDEEWTAGAKAYFQAHDQFWQQHSPDFHKSVFKPWYDKNVAPKLG